jgi:hypothetical protein
MIRAGGFDGMTAGSRSSRGSENEGKNRNMASGKDLRRMADALAGTIEAPHFDRAAFKVARIYVTLAADGRTANFKFTPDEQEFKCMLAPRRSRRCRAVGAGRAGPPQRWRR